MGRTVLASLLCLICVACSGGAGDSALQPIAASDYPELDRALQQAFVDLGIDPARTPAAIAGGQLNAIFDLSVTPDGQDPPQGITLSWTERLVGDYDMNGVVNISDLTALGQHLGESVNYKSQGVTDYIPAGDPDAAGAANWRTARVDGNDDGLITIADVTPIAQHWEQGIDGYIIERAVNEGNGSLSWQAVEPGSGSTPSLERSFAFPAGQSGPDLSAPLRFHVELPLAQHEMTQYWRVRAWDSRSQESGEKSNAAKYTLALADTAPPIWDDTVGVTEVGVGSGQATLHFGTASDEDSPPVGYTVYWDELDPENPDAPLDYDTANALAVPQDRSPCTLTGLANEQAYRFAVRAHDSAEPPNEEHNTVSIVAVPNEGDVYPPEWQGEPGIRDLYYGNGKVTIAFNAALDGNDSSGRHYESNPVVYRVYYGPGSQPDWDSASTLDFPDIGLAYYFVDLPGIDTDILQWFAVRALDSAAPPNNDGNTEFLLGHPVEFQVFPVPPPGPQVPVAGEVRSQLYAFNADRSAHRLLVSAIGETEHWVSSYELTEEGFVHHGDMPVVAAADAREFIVKSAALDEKGKLQLLFNCKYGLGTKQTVGTYDEGSAASQLFDLKGLLQVDQFGHSIDARH